MTVRELMELLESADPDTEVRFMAQPSWPFEYSISGTWEPSRNRCTLCGKAVVLEESDESWVHEEGGSFDHFAEPEDEEQSDDFSPEGASEVIYLVEGEQLGYGTKRAWEEDYR
jgi:hypothetical protein